MKAIVYKTYLERFDKSEGNKQTGESEDLQKLPQTVR